MQLRTIVLGPPASGKSTLTQYLLQTITGLGHFAVRLHFAAQMKQGSDLGEQARPFAEKQLWLPDELVIEALGRECKAGHFRNGFLIEGLPGNLRQAELLEQLLSREEIKLDCLIYLQASDEVCLQRAATRRVCKTCDGGVNQTRVNPLHADQCAVCGSLITVRPDDHTEAFRRRLAIHRAMMCEIQPWVSKQRTIFLNAQRPIEWIRQEVLAQLNAVGMVR